MLSPDRLRHCRPSSLVKLSNSGEINMGALVTADAFANIQPPELNGDERDTAGRYRDPSFLMVLNMAPEGHVLKDVYVLGRNHKTARNSWARGYSTCRSGPEAWLSKEPTRIQEGYNTKHEARSPPQFGEQSKLTLEGCEPNSCLKSLQRGY